MEERGKPSNTEAGRGQVADPVQPTHFQSYEQYPDRKLTPHLAMVPLPDFSSPRTVTSSFVIEKFREL